MITRHSVSNVLRNENLESAKNYFLHSEQQLQAAKDLANGIFKQIEIPLDKCRIYDVGCGTGDLLRHLQIQGCKFSLWGSDLSSKRIKTAREINSESKLKDKIHYKSVDAQHACQFVNTYDIVFCTSMLHQVPMEDHPAVYKQLFSSCRAGGYLGVVTYGRSENGLTPVSAAIENFMKQNAQKFSMKDYSNPRAGLTRKEYNKGLSESGFSLLSSEEKVIYINSDPTQLAPYLKGFLPYYQHLCFVKKDFKLANQYIDQLSKYLRDIFPQGLPIMHFEIIARKPMNQLDHAVAFFTRSQTREQKLEPDAMPNNRFGINNHA